MKDRDRPRHCQEESSDIIPPTNNSVTRTTVRPWRQRSGWRFALVAALALHGGCAPSPLLRPADEDRTPPVTLTQVSQLAAFEPYLPILSDSLVALYRKYDERTFYSVFETKVIATCHLIDSLNGFVEQSARIDTLAIDHTVENFGVAARRGRTIFLSSSYFFLFEGVAVLRSALTHEFGHILYSQLGAGAKAEIDSLWGQMRTPALYYLFRDGEYSENARFGGHPDDSPGELFASAFNLFSNRSEEFDARLLYVETRHHALVARIRALIVRSAAGRRRAPDGEK